MTDHLWALSADRHSPCPACGRPVTWVVTRTGELLPCDDQDTIITDDGELVEGWVLHLRDCEMALVATRAWQEGKQ